MPSAAERFLLDFHSRHAGATAFALGGIAMRSGDRVFASSYEALAAEVPAGAAAVLDLACGDGFLLERIAALRPGAVLAGIDMSREELTAAAARLGERAALHLGRAQSLPFRDHCFDAVTCHLALMLMEEPASVLRELRRVLRPGGLLAAVVGGQLPPSDVLELFRSLLRPAIAAAPGVVAIGDRRWRAPGSIETLLAEAGFTGFRHTLLEGAIELDPPAMWDWLSLMYDIHFLDDETRARLREAFLATVSGPQRMPVASLLLSATSP